ncbi:MAG: 3-phosphoshikimate 1-carboxyvinyltransferase [Clostridiales bacterium]|nr:3-phosphoshikimate 1-carboxyvinyltransferase [Clostridiales bacterium]
MQVVLKKAFLQGEVDIIMSKSYAHRLLILSALSDNSTKIVGRSDAQDILATISCLKALGAEIIDTYDGYLVHPITNAAKYSVCNAGESGSTLRFLLPVSAIFNCQCQFEVTGRLSKRPLEDLANALIAGGVEVTKTAPYKVSGKLKSGEYTIRGDISSQYISGLMFALPLLEGDSKIIIEGNLASKSYIDITLDAINKFGVDIEETHYGYFIKGGQRYISPKEVKVECDWSNGAFFLAAGAINGDMLVKGLDISSKQGDKEIYNILRKMGADITSVHKGIRVKKSKLKAIEIDADNIPDLVPIISVLCSYASNTSVIKNVERLRYKESDRIESTIKMMSSLGIQIGYNGNLNVQGGKVLGGTVDGYNDHRIVMSASIAALNARGETLITTAKAVQKSYPNFFSEYKALGGQVNVIE